MQRKSKRRNFTQSLEISLVLERVFNRAAPISFLEKLCTVNDKIIKTQLLIFSLLSKEKKNSGNFTCNRYILAEFVASDSSITYPAHKLSKARRGRTELSRPLCTLDGDYQVRLFARSLNKSVSFCYFCPFL